MKRVKDLAIIVCCVVLIIVCVIACIFMHSIYSNLQQNTAEVQIDDTPEEDSSEDTETVVSYGLPKDERYYIDENGDIQLYDIIPSTEEFYTDVPEEAVEYFEHIIDTVVASTMDEYEEKCGHELIYSSMDLSYDVNGVGYAIYHFKNTDLVLASSFDFSFSESEFYPYAVGNLYGSDYSVIYFTNGLPDNSKELYEIMYDQGTHWDYYTTDYAGGDTMVLVSNTDGTTCTVDLSGLGG